MRVPRRHTILFTSLFLLLGCGDGQDQNPGTSGGNTGGNPDIQIERPENAIDGQYIFFLDTAKVTPAMAKTVAEELLAPHGGVLLEVYEGALVGFAANNLDDAKALAMAKDTRINVIGQDGYGELNEIQQNAPFTLDRIDSRPFTLDSKYEYHLTGAGVHAYVLDTGIRSTHQEFTGRIGAGKDFINDGKGTEDCHGHGTHVAGLLGGSTYGVAKGVTLHPVRVVGCDGIPSLSGMLAGIDWVIKNRISPAVINMSAGTSAYSPLDQMALAAIKAGIPFVTAAGNRDKSSCTYSPGLQPEVINVGASEDSKSKDYWQWYTNSGPCIDLFAPGNHPVAGQEPGILSAGHTSDTATALKGGTSMAAPQVAGAIALHLELNPAATPDQLSKALVAGATPGLLSTFGLRGAPNLFLYSRYMEPKGSFPVKRWDDYYVDAGPWDDDAKYWGTIGYADINGDKKMDVCGRAPNGIVCRLSDGTTFGATALWTSNFGDGGGFDALQSYWGTLRFPDLNGDGKADVCARAAAGIYCGLSTGTSFDPITLWDDYYTDAGVWDDDPKYWGTIQYADLNGDKKMDVCGRAPNGIVCRLSEGTKFGATAVWTSNFGDGGGFDALQSYWGTVRLPDLNGDGKADVCARASNGISCGLSNGTTFDPVTLWDDYYTDGGPWDEHPSYWATIQYADLDGDKKADVCGRAANGMVCRLSTGTTFAPPAPWSNAYFVDDGVWNVDGPHWPTIHLTDINGDGKADVCGRTTGGLFCMQSRGNRFAFPAMWETTFNDGTGWGASAHHWATIAYPDLNGDGRMDVCGRSSAGLACGLSTP